MHGPRRVCTSRADGKNGTEKTGRPRIMIQKKGHNVTIQVKSLKRKNKQNPATLTQNKTLKTVVTGTNYKEMINVQN